MSDIKATPPADTLGDVDFLQLIRVLWRGKWIIAGATVLTTIIAIVIAFSIANVYRSEALLVAVGKKKSSDLTALSSQFGGIASLAGINLTDGSTDEVTLAIATLNSKKFITDFIQKHDILVPLMAAEKWNGEEDRLILDSDLYDSENGVWTRDVNPPKLAKPSFLEAYETFIRNFQVTRDADSGLVRISIENYSPKLAKKWLDWLIEDINETIKENDVSLAMESVVFLNEQVRMTPVSDMQNMLFRLIEEQTRTILLANVLPEYVLRTIDPAVVAEEPIKPNRLFICMIGATFGSLLAGIALVLRAGVMRMTDASI